MNLVRLAAYGSALLTIVLWFPSTGTAQKVTPWTDAQCRARMEQLFKMTGDPSGDLNEVLADIGDRAGSSFAIYCRTKEANSIKILQHHLDNIEAYRQEIASANNRTEKAGKKMEKVHDTNSTYDPFGFPTRN